MKKNLTGYNYWALAALVTCLAACGQGETPPDSGESADVGVATSDLATSFDAAQPDRADLSLVGMVVADLVVPPDFVCTANVQTDPMNCGACGNACPGGTNQSGECQNSRCVKVCNPGFADCDKDDKNGCEINIATDVINCGACGASCKFDHAGVMCAGGVCLLGRCDAGYGDCDGMQGNGCETDLKSSNSNCGACGNVCGNLPAALGVCAAGACRIQACLANFADCDMLVANGCEVDLFRDDFNCGACSNACPGVNAKPRCFQNVCGFVCFADFADCDAKPVNGCETNIAGDVANCGACGNICAKPDGPNAVAVCKRDNQGLIVCATECIAPFADCDGDKMNGCESNINTDVDNCGRCGSMCFVLNSVPVCKAGQCETGSCNPGFADCDVQPGCETGVNRNVFNCGACGNNCAAPHVSAPICEQGACLVKQCDPQYGDCDKDQKNGCEVKIDEDPNNCGACGKACPGAPNAVAACKVLQGPFCAIDCVPGWGDCDGNVMNGCEADLTTPKTCGACFKACQFWNAAPLCQAGGCKMGLCDVGWGNCDNNELNGCERDVSRDIMNCGTCGNVCSFPNAPPKCDGGVCRRGACFPGFDDCNKVELDGCESQLDRDPKNCGACGNVCPNYPNAVGGCFNAGGGGQKCAIDFCLAGFADCDFNDQNGCEVAVSNDPRNCGACRNVCAGGKMCNAGKCI